MTRADDAIARMRELAAAGALTWRVFLDLRCEVLDEGRPELAKETKKIALGCGWYEEPPDLDSDG